MQRLTSFMPCLQERWEEPGAEYALPSGTDPAAVKELSAQAVQVNSLGSNIFAQQCTLSCLRKDVQQLDSKSKHH